MYLKLFALILYIVLYSLINVKCYIMYYNLSFLWEITKNGVCRYRSIKKSPLNAVTSWNITRPSRHFVWLIEKNGQSQHPMHGSTDDGHSWGPTLQRRQSYIPNSGLPEWSPLEIRSVQQSRSSQAGSTFGGVTSSLHTGPITPAVNSTLANILPSVTVKNHLQGKCTYDVVST